MSLYIVKVSGTVGKPQVLCVVSSKEQKFIHTPLNVWVEKEFGQFATVEYIEVYHLATISLTDLDVDRILCLDELQD